MRFASGPQLTHAEARQLHKEKRYEEISLNLSRMALSIAARYNRRWSRLPREELEGEALLALVAAVPRWQPRRYTFKQYFFFAVWNHLNIWRRRERAIPSCPYPKTGFAQNRRVVSISGGCFAELEELLDSVLTDQMREVFVRRYGLRGHRQYEIPELVKHFCLPRHQVRQLITRSVQWLHNVLFPDDQITYQEALQRLRNCTVAEAKVRLRAVKDTRNAGDRNRYRRKQGAH